MNSKLLKLEPPYNIIYAGGHIGRHIATLLTWEDPEPEELQIPYAASYAVIDQGNKMPAGATDGKDGKDGSWRSAESSVMKTICESTCATLPLS